MNLIVTEELEGCELRMVWKGGEMCRCCRYCWFDDVQMIVREMTSVPSKTRPAAVARTATAAGTEEPKESDQRLRGTLCAIESAITQVLLPLRWGRREGDGGREPRRVKRGKRSRRVSYSSVCFILD